MSDDIIFQKNIEKIWREGKKVIIFAVAFGERN